MKNIGNCWQGVLLFLLISIHPLHTVGQEVGLVSSGMLKASDTGTVLALIRRGSNLIYTKTDSALILFREAKYMSQQSRFYEGFGFALANEGLALTTLGNYEQGFACYSKALPYCLRAKQIKIALIQLYFNMALSWGDKEDYLKANKYYHKALALLLERFPENNLFLISVYNNMIAVQANMGSYAQALLYADKASLLAKKHDKKKLSAQVIMNKGDIYFTMKRYDSALACYNVASEIVLQLPDDELRHSYYLRMGDVHLIEGQYKEGLQYLLKAKQLSGSVKPLSGIMADYSLGEALFQLDRDREAEKILQAALARADQTGLTKNKQNGHSVLIALYEKEGRYREAFEHQRQYQQLSDSIISLDKIRSVNEIEIKYQVTQKDKELIGKELTIAKQEQKLYQKNMTIGAILLLGIGGFAYYRYKRKISLSDRKIEQLKAMMDGEENERVRLARELHDGLGGMLTGIKLNLRSIQRQPDLSVLKKDLTGIMDMLQSMGEEIRQAAHNLMPDMLVKHRLKEALQLYCEQLDSDGRLKIDLQFYGDFSMLDRTVELQLYRIVQELVHNILRHAKASFAAIQIRHSDGMLCMSVEDNGHGFDTESEVRGIGLSNIEARMKAMNGYFSISSTASMGTTAYLEFPLSDKMMNA